MRPNFPHVRVPGVALVIALCLGPVSAIAQEETPETQPAERINYAAGHVWMGSGLGASIVAIDGDARGTLIALSTEGAVYRRPAGGAWREVLGPTGVRLGDGDGLDEEAILLDAEGFIDEFEDMTIEFEPAFGEEEADEVEGDDTEPEAPADLDEFEDMPDDLTELYLLDEQGDGTDANPRSGGVVWMSTLVADLALVSRADGLWRSTDGGDSWTPTDALGEVHAFSDAPRGLIIAGTPYGRRFSKDEGRTWHSNLDPISRIETFDFAVDGEKIYAGTAEGLFLSKDGLSWAKLLSRYDADVPIWNVAVDRHWDGGLWVTGPVGILRSDDGGEQLRAAGRNMLAGTRSLLPLSSPGHLLAAGVDGVWESRDGGMRWRPVVNGLPSPANHWLTEDANGPVLGGIDGVFHLTKAAPVAITQPAEAQRTPEGADMGSLTVIALNRPGMAMSEIVTRGAIARSLLLPKLTVRGRWNQDRMLSADYGARSNDGHYRTSWSLGLTACFGGCNSTSGYSSYIEDVGMEAAQSSGSVAVVGDEVYNTSGEGSLAPMAANVAERVTRYRTDVANRVTELVLARHRLLEARPVVQTLSLREQVAHQLDVAESTARLDVYTNGYFSRVLEGS